MKVKKKKESFAYSEFISIPGLISIDHAADIAPCTCKKVFGRYSINIRDLLGR